MESSFTFLEKNFTNLMKLEKKLKPKPNEKSVEEKEFLRLRLI